MTTPPLPVWNPRGPTTLLKEEYLQFHKDTTIYHDHTDGWLYNFAELHAQIPPLPPPLKVFTDKGVILAHASDLCAHLSELRYLFMQGQTANASHTPSVESTARPTVPQLKSTLPSAYNGTSSKA